MHMCMSLASSKQASHSACRRENLARGTTYNNVANTSLRVLTMGNAYAEQAPHRVLSQNPSSAQAQSVTTSSSRCKLPSVQALVVARTALHPATALSSNTDLVLSVKSPFDPLLSELHRCLCMCRREAIWYEMMKPHGNIAGPGRGHMRMHGIFLPSMPPTFLAST